MFYIKKNVLVFDSSNAIHYEASQPFREDSIINESNRTEVESTPSSAGDLLPNVFLHFQEKPYNVAWRKSHSGLSRYLKLSHSPSNVNEQMLLSNRKVKKILELSFKELIYVIVKPYQDRLSRLITFDPNQVRGKDKILLHYQLFLRQQK